MIVSYERKFIFLKTQKVAGSSIEMYLRQFCGSEDIVTPLNDDEESAVAQLGFRPPTPVHYRRVRPRELLQPDVLDRSRTNLHTMIRSRRPPWRRNWLSHHPAHAVRSQIGRKEWARCFRFSVTRNPWDQVVSMYFWQLSTGDADATIDGAIETVSKNWNIYTIRNRIAVDHVIRFHNLLSDFGDVCDLIGVPRPVELPRLKAGLRPPKVHPRDLLTPAQIDRVARLARREIEEFGYEL